MIFEIRRTSMWGDEKPHEKAFLHSMPVYDTRTCSEEHYNTYTRFKSVGTFALPWREYGTEHSVDEKGHIKRRIKDEVRWAVKVDNLEELLQFCKESEIIVSMGDTQRIEIYDDYRE